MARRRRRGLQTDNVCPFCKKVVYHLPKGMKVGSDEAREWYQREVQFVETRVRITGFHRTCYLNQIRNGGSSLG